jgi:hypothetical protein
VPPDLILLPLQQNKIDEIAPKAGTRESADFWCAAIAHSSGMMDAETKYQYPRPRLARVRSFPGVATPFTMTT